MNIEDAMNIKNTDIASHLKLPPVKLHCSMLAEDAIKAAVKDYKSKKVVVENAWVNFENRKKTDHKYYNIKLIWYLIIKIIKIMT